jgi:hypothetical protein
MTVDKLESAIISCGRQPYQRNTMYEWVGLPEEGGSLAKDVHTG